LWRENNRNQSVLARRRRNRPLLICHLELAENKLLLKHLSASQVKGRIAAASLEIRFADSSAAVPAAVRRRVTPAAATVRESSAQPGRNPAATPAISAKFEREF
jgi:hypothetical protein